VWVLGGALLGLIAAVVGVGWQPTAVVGPVLGVLGALAAEADLRTRRIPDRLIVAGWVAAAALAVVAELTDGTLPALSMVVSASMAAMPLLIVHLVEPAQVGFGDVKLCAAVGALLGVLSWTLGAIAVFSAMLLALVGILLRLWPSRSIPFAACLAVAGVGFLAVGRWAA
jgi:leader peptidase (prepilin peptidase)/N-methyltransferase